MVPFLNVIPGGRCQEQDFPPKNGGINRKNGGENCKMAPHLRKKTCYSGKNQKPCNSGVRGIKMAPFFLNMIPGGRFQEQGFLQSTAGLIDKMAGKTIRWRHILERRSVIQKKTKNLYLRSEGNQNGAIFKRDT